MFSVSLRVQMTIFHYWFRSWLGADQATSHYLNQWRLVHWRIYASLGLNGLIWKIYWHIEMLQKLNIRRIIAYIETDTQCVCVLNICISYNIFILLQSIWFFNWILSRWDLVTGNFGFLVSASKKIPRVINDMMRTTLVIHFSIPSSKRNLHIIFLMGREQN